MTRTLDAAQVFDGTMLHGPTRVHVDHGRISRFDPLPAGAREQAKGLLVPGFVDLQVNGGGGVLLGRSTDPRAIDTICAAHARLGVTALFPTLITATPEHTSQTLRQAQDAAGRGVPGFAGLHLEGPHLDPARAGAHDPALIRPLTDADIAQYTRAAAALRLIITLAPEAATPAQITTLASAGITVFLGHSDTTDAAARAAFDAGATGVTHLYNAMSPLTHRAPGLVGAAMDGAVVAGIIADGHHVSATAFRIAVRAMGQRLFAVSDAMAVAGTDLSQFMLDGRDIERRDGRLTLPDGTLAGADLSPSQALRWMVTQAGIPVADALAMWTSRPAAAAGLTQSGHLRPGDAADMVLLDTAFEPVQIWRAGQPKVP